MGKLAVHFSPEHVSSYIKSLGSPEKGFSTMSAVFRQLLYIRFQFCSTSENNRLSYSPWIMIKNDPHRVRRRSFNSIASRSFDKLS